ncbi:MAG: sodium:calcium antiporter [Paludibacterium sp.]|uniref:sodium:calcium antiporter n=1 Tax=Paludibacterium sp. TaxID=1917523 RepID=UPI0025FE31B0|nr:sodium:calcium antiporter [Paludibacterium sp.]MBV8046635.1 sodium:calcium antiporter [Paludibacterium sp.]MBV8648632.1 sodium:calcium antiporter [Paludibacterium sp.]
MFTTFATLLSMLLIILIAAETFTNALEHLGHRLGISEGVTGSLFAAVGTAMPETMVPLLAIFDGGAGREVNQEIGVGAILGAPLMLSTLSVCLMGLSVWRTRGPKGAIAAERSGLMRDLHVFLGAYALSALAMFLPQQGHWAASRALVCLLLVLLYLLYVMSTLRASSALVEQGHGTEAETPLLLSRLGLPVGLVSIGLQLALALGLLVGGAEGFIAGVEAASRLLGISPLLLSLMVIPIATELPEKINSILWIRRGKDTLALGNITGAMVFQGTLLPAMGIALTPWSPRPDVFIPLVFTLGAATWLCLMARRGLRVGHLALNGAAYLLYLAISL